MNENQLTRGRLLTVWNDDLRNFKLTPGRKHVDKFNGIDGINEIYNIVANKKYEEFQEAFLSVKISIEVFFNKTIRDVGYDARKIYIMRNARNYDLNDIEKIGPNPEDAIFDFETAIQALAILRNQMIREDITKLIKKYNENVLNYSKDFPIDINNVFSNIIDKGETDTYKSIIGLILHQWIWKN